MTPQAFEIFSKYWAAPVSNIVIVIAAILLLYPIIWNMAVKQLSNAAKALMEAKQLPETLVRITEASDRLSSFNTSMETLRSRLELLDDINAKLSVAGGQLEAMESRARGEGNGGVQPGGPPGEAENWEKLNALWQDAKFELERLVSSVSDGRVRRKYNALPRHQYYDVLDCLTTDGLVSPAEAKAYRKMNELYLSHRNRRVPVTDTVLRKFTELHNSLRPTKE